MSERLVILAAQRELTIAVGRHNPRRSSGELAAAVRLARAVDVAVTEVARVTGLARQTIYELARADDPRAVNPALHVLLLVVHGVNTGSVIADELGMTRPDVNAHLSALAHGGSVELVRPGRTNDVIALPDERAAAEIDRYLDETRGRHYDKHGFYVEVPDVGARRKLLAAADASQSEAVELLPALTSISGGIKQPEIAVGVAAATGRRAFEVFDEFWADLVARADVAGAHTRLVLHLAPTGRSVADLDGAEEHTEAGASRTTVD